MNTIKSIRAYTYWWFVICLIVACKPEPKSLITTQAVTHATATWPSTFTPLPEQTYPVATTSPLSDRPTPTSQPLPSPTPTAPPTLSPIPTQTLIPIATVIPTEVPLMAPPEGLVYWIDGDLWHINEDGVAVRYFDQIGSTFSFYGAQLLYENNNDIWLFDFDENILQNLTNTPDRNECCPRWWLGTNQIVFGSWPLDYTPFISSFGYRELGYLSITNLDGTGYEILDENNIIDTWLAPAPYQPVILYGHSIYVLDQGISPLNVNNMLPADETSLRYWKSPAWSPDGSYLALYASRRKEGEDRSKEGIILVNWAEQTAEYLHEYIVVGTDAVPDSPAWSMDGRYLAFDARNDDVAHWGLWIYDVENRQPVFSPSQNQQLRFPNFLVWHQTTNTLICSTYEGYSIGFYHWVIDPLVGVIGQLDLPSDAIPVHWD